MYLVHIFKCTYRIIICPLLREYEVRIVRTLFSRRLLAEEFQLVSDGDAVDMIGWMAIARQADDS
jgi:hypothetical protein